MRAPGRQKSGKPCTIGLLIPNVFRANEEMWWRSAMDAARSRGANLVCFSGGYLDIGDALEAQASILYALVGRETLDGLIVFSTTGWFMGKEKLVEFCKRYEPLPVVTVDVHLPGMPGVAKSNFHGMREAIRHLIEEHGHRRIAFLCGPEKADWARERLRAYTEALVDHGLKVDARLIAPAPATWEFAGPVVGPAAQQINVLLDERKLEPGVDFDALAGATDSLIHEAVEVLQARGVRIPERLAVTGFDDEPASRMTAPPLTTVRSPLQEMSRAAVELILRRIAGEEVAEAVSLPCTLVVRESCGCPDPCVAAASASAPAVVAPGAPLAGAELGAELARVAAAAGVEGARPELDAILDGFAAGVGGGEPGAFLGALEKAIERSTATLEEASRWHSVLSALRGRVLPGLHAGGAEAARAETLLQQAQVLVGRFAERAQVRKRFHDQQRELEFLRVSTALLATPDPDALMDTLAAELPGLGIPSCYLSLFENPQEYRYPDAAPEWARLVLAYGPRGRRQLDPAGLRFPSRRLIPDELWPGDEPHSFVLVSLRFRERQLGFAVLESGPRQGRLFEALRTQIGSALQGALLVQRVRERSAELARQQYIIDSFMENVPDCIYFKDQESRITRANKAHAVKMGLQDPADEIGRTDFDFFPEEQARAKFEQERRILETGKPLVDLEEPDGIGRWALTTKMPLRDERGDILGTFGISRDITALKNAQSALERAYADVEAEVQERTAQLRREIAERTQAEQEVKRLNQELEGRVTERTAQLQDALKEMEAFSYSVSHDLRTPLRAMDGFSRILLADHASQLSPDAARHLRTIRESSQRMSRLIDDLLSFSRLSRQPLSTRPVAVADLVQEVLHDLGGEREGRAVEIAVRHLPACQGDPSLLRQVWFNLIANALKFTRGRAPARIEIASMESGGELAYLVRDNGVGFDMRYASKLFRVFQRLHRDEEFEGTGIGLAIVQRIIHRHGGRVWAESTPGVGSVFYFTPGRGDAPGVAPDRTSAEGGTA